ncbi:hypothetical protein EWK04_13130 [Salmonella enterica subsp. enterica serovar Java]|uniref:Uncharacterized protein n=1 Tax=Salmonella enterica subsp. enterica serovar Java TaxID=224729 RepID=A0A3Y9C4F1_SALEB|nr:hypothetical protein [Salmonella enterica subsp. enterica serovar Java]ECG3199708.1 hypothetical protein [Salmonella enterica subsp. enterica serovar Java]EDC4055911.1 hypothetical protein [Salmonella enterica subsp. enterica serovar Java]
MVFPDCDSRRKYTGVFKYCCQQAKLRRQCISAAQPA